MSEPAYTRLDVDERRRRLLAFGAELFARHAYDELSMARIAREAGISKALLYHYFPSKQAYSRPPSSRPRRSWRRPRPPTPRCRRSSSWRAASTRT